MNVLKWTPGRQGTGYFKCKVMSGLMSLPFDVYLLKFPQYSHIPVHTDTVDSGKHYRMNIILKHAEIGGEFITDDSIYNGSRIKLFRPDETPHSVSRVERGTRYVLSIGWVHHV